MWFFTALFGGLMLLSVKSRRRMIAIMLIGCVAVLGVAPPTGASSILPALCNPDSTNDHQPDNR